MSATQYRRTGLYSEYFRICYPRVEDVAAIHISGHKGPIFALAVCRNRRSFTEHDRFLLNLLRSHLRHAYRNSQTLGALQHTLKRQNLALEAVDQGVVALTRSGRITTVTDRARSYLGEHFGFRTGTRLPDSLLGWVKHQRVLLEGDRLAATSLEPLVVEREDKKLIVRLVPGADQTLLFFTELHRHDRSDLTRLESLGLTPREAEVLCWVSRGRTNIDISRILDIKPRTVGKHIEHIFAKLGVETRTAAAIRAIEHLEPASSA